MIYKAKLDPGYPRNNGEIKYCTLFYIVPTGEYAVYSPCRSLMWTETTSPVNEPGTYDAELQSIINTYLSTPLFGEPAREVGLESDLFPGLIRLFNIEKEVAK